MAELDQHRRVGKGSFRYALAHLDAYLAAYQLGITVASRRPRGTEQKREGVA